MRSRGTVAAEIPELGVAGQDAGEQGRVAIAGAAGLGGTLRLAYADGVSVTLGDTFRLFSAGSIVGAFDATSVTPGSPYLRVNIVQDAHGMRFTVIHLAVYDMDFDVDVPDLFSFQSAWFSV